MSDRSAGGLLLRYLRNSLRSMRRAGRTATSTVRRSGSEKSRDVFGEFEGLCGVTDTGRVRDHNEDRVHVTERGRIMIVADGMGGHSAGDVAAEKAISAIVECLESDAKSETDGSSDTYSLVMESAINRAQDTVLAASSEEGPKGMGCTLILACIRENRLLMCHVGDVRGYHFRGDKLLAHTQDHSVVGELIACGELMADQARDHPERNEVLQAVGMPAGFRPELNLIDLDPGDRVLLCSDGLWEMLSDEQITEMVSSDGSMRQLATQMVDRANYLGGHDNISVVLYEHGPQ